MDFDSERIFYSDQSLRAPPPKFTDPFAVVDPAVTPGADENGDPNNVNAADDAKYEEEKRRRKDNVQGKGRNNGVR